MSVAVLEPTAVPTEPKVGPDAGRSVAAASDWIDPEGDDWLSVIYLELAPEAESARAGGAAAGPQFEHWFG